MGSEQWNFFIDDESEEAFTDEEKSGRDCIICAIDCSEPMFIIKTVDGLTHFELSIKVIFNLYNRKCLTNERDFVGILFFNTEKSKNTHNFENIYIFDDLGLPGDEKVKAVEKLITVKDVRRNFNETFGHADCKLDEMFWTCATMFNNSGLKDGVRKIFLFTNCDNPHKDDLNRQKRVHQKIQDLQEQQVTIEVMPVGQDFRWEYFFYGAIYHGEKAAKPNPLDKFNELLDRTMRKQYHKRAMATVNFSLAPGVELSCSLYNMISPARVPAPIKLDIQTNEELKTTKSFIKTETGETILRTDLKMYQTYGGSKIAMQSDEVEQLRKLCPPGLVLLGFHNKNLVKPFHHIRQCLFMYPTDSTIKGSTFLFKCLLERCATKDVVAICRLTARANMLPRLVALLPQLEVLDAHGFQDEPPGFHVVYLPYADDVRDLGSKINHLERPKAQREHIDKTKEMVEKLLIDYDPDTIANPVLQSHYKAIEAFALDRVDVENVPDHTQPNVDWMSRKAGHAMNHFIRRVYSDDYSSASTSKKRDIAKPVINYDLEQQARSGRLPKLTIAVLKELCLKNGIRLTATRKADIISQINVHYGI